MHPLFYLLLGPAVVLAHPLLTRRDLIGLFGDVDQPIPETKTLLGEATLAMTKARGATGTISHDATTITATSGSTSTSTIPLYAATTAELKAATSTANPSISTQIPYLPPPTSAEETTQWKVIGIGIITVGFIATVILSIVFFDSWWNFLCDLCGCGKQHKHGGENMVPDWEKRDWEFKLANEDGHRYPTISSLGNIAKEQEKKKLKDTKVAPLPMPEVFQDFDPYPLEPLTRRPSMR